MLSPKPKPLTMSASPVSPSTLLSRPNNVSVTKNTIAIRDKNVMLNTSNLPATIIKEQMTTTATWAYRWLQNRRNPKRRPLHANLPKLLCIAEFNLRSFFDKLDVFFQDIDTPLRVLF